MQELKVFEAFAGIGAQRKALEEIGRKYKIVGMAEWYVPAIISYQAIHNNLKIEPIDHKIKKRWDGRLFEKKTLSIDSKKLLIKTIEKEKIWMN